MGMGHGGLDPNKYPKEKAKNFLLQSYDKPRFTGWLA
jgi:hypothetical protein